MSSGELVEARIGITGRVQGVGFRPFIYRVAVRNGLVGYVINLGDAGVEILVEGKKSQVTRFLRDVREEAPDVSEIEDIVFEYGPHRGRFKEFAIDKSQSRGRVASGIYPPDIGICPQCLEDMATPGSRWYEYPFTACAWCGPRFTSVMSLPYDRERTHMHEFPMCVHCRRDYHDPTDRRFDAQGITCSLCGPEMSLYDANGNTIEAEDPFREVAGYLMEGCVVAVKGIGGIHLASLATRDDVIEEFRSRKGRPYQPFALMSPDLDAVRAFARVDDEEAGLIQSWRKPIVLLKKRHRVVSELVAPGLDTVGVMLPYTGIQKMLFSRLSEPALVMTSGNKKGLPMAISNRAAFEELVGITDYYLLHDREIVNRCDDSILRVIEGNTSFTRRSRGYVPDPIYVPLKKGVGIAVGAELRNAAAVATNGKVFMTQYLGDTDTLEGLRFEEEAIQTMRNLLNITRDPDMIGCDLHPGYMTSQMAEVISREAGVTLVRSQHHHAHIVSVMAENNVSRDGEILGIALDGAGYGSDRQIWGGEILKSSYSEFKRLGHLENLPMPGGDLCTYHPYRMLIAGLSNAVTDDVICDITENHVERKLPHGKTELEVIIRQLNNRDIIKTSSSGRFLDSIAALLGLTYYRSYEGEPAMRLEAFASGGDSELIDHDIEIHRIGGKYVLNTSNTLYFMSKILKKHKKQNIAAFGQKYLSDGVSEMAIKASEDTGISVVGLSGGVFANEYITKTVMNNLRKAGLTVLLNTKVPPGDGGTALGQICKALDGVM